MDSKKRAILIMDANQRSALAVTRALGVNNRYILTSADSSSSSLAGSSKYSSNYRQYPSPEHKPIEFLQWVKENCLSNEYDLVVPTTEVTSQLLLAHSEELKSLPLAYSDYATVMSLANKSNLVKAALDANIPVPESIFYQNSDDVDIETIHFPCVIKPSLSKIYTGHSWISTTVRIAHSIEGLRKIFSNDTYLQEHTFMIQEFIPGHGAGVFALFNQGKAIQFFAHQRLREKPPEGGVSVLSQAAEIDISLRTHAEKLLSSVAWNGVAMVEFRIATNGSPYLMEVNTRFWGSLQLAIDSGVNFPQQLVSVFFGETVEPVHSYNKQQRLRWLLGDLDSLYIYLKSAHSLTDKAKRVLSFLAPHFSNQRHEVNRIGDMRPFWYELKKYISLLRGQE